MVAYNFSAQFEPAIRSGEKLQTIRRAGKRRPPVPGDQLQLYTGMRTRSCRLLNRGICTRVIGIKIRPKYREVVVQLDERFWQIIDSDKSLSQLATDDGFGSVEAFFQFFEAQLGAADVEFIGHVIVWEVLDDGA